MTITGKPKKNVYTAGILLSVLILAAGCSAPADSPAEGSGAQTPVSEPSEKERDKEEDQDAASSEKEAEEKEKAEIDWFSLTVRKTDAGETDSRNPFDVVIKPGVPGVDYPVLTIDLKELKEEADGAAGVLIVPSVPLTYPVMWKAFDNDYYLEHDIYGESDLNGCVFIDGWNDPSMTDVNTIIYGHNMRDGSMFGANSRLLSSPGRADREPYIFYYTEKTVKKYRIFAFYTTDDENEVYELPELEYPDIVINPKEKDLETRLGIIDSKEYARKVHNYFNRWYDTFVRTLQENSGYSPEEKISYGMRPRTILLSTCYGQAHGHTRFIIAGVLVDEYIAKEE